MKSIKSVQYYQDKLIEYDLIMDMALENLKKSYPLYKITNSAEYSKIYYNDSANVEKVFHDLFLLQNNLIKDSNTLSQLMEKQNNIIHNAKINYKKQSKLLSEQKDNDLASKPREKAYAKELTSTYVKTFINIFGIVTTIYILYSNIHKLPIH